MCLHVHTHTHTHTHTHPYSSRKLTGLKIKIWEVLALGWQFNPQKCMRLFWMVRNWNKNREEIDTVSHLKNILKNLNAQTCLYFLVCYSQVNMPSLSKFSISTRVCFWYIHTHSYTLWTPISPSWPPSPQAGQRISSWGLWQGDEKAGREQLLYTCNCLDVGGITRERRERRDL